MITFLYKWPFFSWGMLVGVGVGIISFLFLKWEVQKVLQDKYNLFFIGFGYIIKLFLIGGALYVSMLVSKSMFLGCAIGFFLLRIVFIFCAVKK